MRGLMPGASDAGMFQLGGGEGHVNRRFTALCSIVPWEPTIWAACGE